MNYLARAATAAVVIAFVKLFLGRRRRNRSSDHSNDSTSSQQSDSTPDFVDSDSVPLPIGEYEVFLSFRGPDTRDSITNILYRFLAHSKIRTFRDDEELRKGEGIWSNLVKAIGQSKISILIFSPCYAESKWCLKELAEIVEHKKREKGHVILPIFYLVDPGDVRRQTGPYEEAFKQHKRNINFDEKTIETWKVALTEIGSLKGWHIKTKEEEVNIADVVSGVVWSHLSKNNNELETDELVKIDDQVKEVVDMLDLDSQGMKVVGLHGMGGIGKTTLATTVYNKVSACFDRIESVGSLVEAKKIIRERVTQFKILVVLDDVDENFNFEEVLGNSKSFASGSRFIVTSRDIQVLRRLSRDQSKLYKVQEMNHTRSLQLFCKHAFKKDSPQSGFEALSNAIISTTGGLPLTLKVIGSLLYLEEEEVWKDRLEQLREIPEEGVMKRLEISYKGLRYEAQQMFLDIACFYIGKSKEFPSYMWSGCNFHPISNINILVQRSMLNIGDDNVFLMHDQLRDMGREIVRREDIEHPWMRSRIWSNEEAHELLLNNKGTDKIKAITLESTRRLSDDHVEFKSTCFTNMSELRYFSGTEVTLIGDFNHLLPNLKWMRLGNHYDEDFVDRKATINVKSLNILEVSNSSGYDFTHMKDAHMLKVLILGNCSKINKLPEFPESESLEILKIESFKNEKEELKIEKLWNLKVLGLNYCELGKIKGGTIGTMMKGLRELELFHTNFDYDSLRRTIADIEELPLLLILNVQSHHLLDVLVGIKLPKSLKKLSTSSDFANPEELKDLVEFTIFRYEVFLNFRGPETRDSITNILYRFLTRSKIHTFIDDDVLRKGGGIFPNLVKAIGQSKISITILSPRYAESKWCLKELVEIVEHKKREKGHIILPIFYMMDPRDVRHQTGLYEVAFTQHKRNGIDEETIQCWKAALTEVGSLKGWHIKTTDEEVDVADVVSGVVWSHLSKNNNELKTDELVEIDDQVKQVVDMLDLNSQGVKVVGLHGMSGIGKTTLAIAVYNKVSTCFHRYSFVKDIRETQKQHGVLALQKNLIYDILRMDSVGSTVEAKRIIRERVTQFKILVVLDDVDENFNFKEVLGNPKSFASGSRFIVTSRDIKVMRRLTEFQSRLYEVQVMNRIRSLQLFCKHAFRKDSPQLGFDALSEAIVSNIVGRPLTLKVIGSLLYREEVEVWKEKLWQLRTIPEEWVMERLKISYDGLRYEAQQIFLDIACFYIGKSKESPSYMWSGCNYHPISSINILVQRSMLNIGDDNVFLMHDQLRDMGREIVRMEDTEHPWMRSRIWSNEEAHELLLNNKGTNIIKAITLESTRRVSDDHVEFKSTWFTNMSGLRYFSGTEVTLIGDFNRLLPNLKWMRLGNHYDDDFLDRKATINVKSLNILEVSSSSGYDFTHMKEAHKLKVLVLEHCSKMSKLPEFPESGNLEILEIRWFKNKEEDLKIEKLQNLKVLRLNRSCEIGKIKGGTIGMMKGLRELNLSGISCDYNTFRQTIVDIQELSSLQILNVESPHLVDVLEGIKLPKSLKKLHTSSRFANVEELLDLEEFTIKGSIATKELAIPPAASSRGGDTSF
ncbi:Disease resistance protein L6 [Linum perenne]